MKPFTAPSDVPQAGRCGPLYRHGGCRQPPLEDPDFESFRPDGQVLSATVQGDIAWVACGAAGVQAVKLGGRLEPIMAHKGANDIIYASLLGNRLFTAEGAGGIGIYEIGADLHLTERGRVKIPDGKGVRQVVVPAPGRFALMHCGGSAIYIVDLQDPVQPRLVLSNPQVGLFYGDQLADKLFDNRYLVAH